MELSQIDNFRIKTEEILARNRKEVVDALEFWEQIWTRKTKNLQLLMDYLGLEVKDIEAKSIVVKKKRKAWRAKWL